MSKYDDIIDLPHHVSKRHPQMPRSSRAAQFAPFAALTGYEACVKEAERLTDFKKELSEDEINELNDTFSKIYENISSRPMVQIEYFVKDEYKSGGRYESIKGRIRIINLAFRTLELEGKTQIPIDDIVSIKELDIDEYYS